MPIYPPRWDDSTDDDDDDIVILPSRQQRRTRESRLALVESNISNQDEDELPLRPLLSSSNNSRNFYCSEEEEDDFQVCHQPHQDDGDELDLSRSVVISSPNQELHEWQQASSPPYSNGKCIFIGL